MICGNENEERKISLNVMKMQKKIVGPKIGLIFSLLKCEMLMRSTHITGS